MTGQTSQVWEVIHDAKKERFALKTLLPEHRGNREQLGFLKHEYTVGKTLDHRRVIKIFDLKSDQGTPYVIMEFFAAPNLKHVIQRGVERVAYQVADIILQAAEGLDYFHRQGWIHRDIKPDNYLLGPDGNVKLIDFALAEKKRSGLAKLFGTKSKIQGTRSYMSPEQIRGKPLDERADIYSFGCTIHELIHGKPPFTGTSSSELLNKHLKSPPPRLEALNRNVTPEMAQLVLGMLAKKPENRPESMSKFLQQYQAIRVFKQTPKPPAEDE